MNGWGKKYSKSMIKGRTQIINVGSKSLKPNIINPNYNHSFLAYYVLIID
jgi:hypothetical protein